MQVMKGFLSKLIGSRAAELALLHLYHYGETYGRAIADDMDSSLLPIQRQLDRLEDCGLLVSKTIGRTRSYTWNPKSPFMKPLKELVKREYESIPLDLRQQLFLKRRRPRRKGKPVIELTT